MNPLFFGASARQLFGAYEAPANSMRDHGVVLCPPFGIEYLCAHPTYRLLARQLAAAGHHVLRLDYHGTGDSAGEFEDTDQAQWVGDIQTAITELKDLGQVSRVALVGMRYGGTLAAHAARACADVDRVVLWDAIVDGRAYLAELGATLTDTSEVTDAGGMAMSASGRRDIAGVTLDAFRLPLPRTLVIASTASAEQHQALAARLAGQGVDSTLRQADDVPAWIEGRLGALALPVATVRSVVEWLS